MKKYPVFALLCIALAARLSLAQVSHTEIAESLAVTANTPVYLPTGAVGSDASWHSLGDTKFSTQFVSYDIKVDSGATGYTTPCSLFVEHLYRSDGFTPAGAGNIPKNNWRDTLVFVGDPADSTWHIQGVVELCEDYRTKITTTKNSTVWIDKHTGR